MGGIVLPEFRTSPRLIGMSAPLDAQGRPALKRSWELVGCLLREMQCRSGPGTTSTRGVSDLLAAWVGQQTDALTVGNLPLWTYRAVGGHGRQFVPVMAAWKAVRLALKLFDDVEDGDAGDQQAEAVNAATSLLVVAQVALEELPECGVPAETAQSVRRALQRTVLRGCVGQQADLRTGRRHQYADPDAWLEIAGSKSGELLAWAAWAGALVAGAEDRAASCYHEYGYRLGVLLQVADDFRDIWHSDGTSDLARGCLNLAVCYALHVPPSEDRSRLAKLLEQASSGSHVAEASARQALTDLGAQAYLLVVSRVQYLQALAALKGVSGSIGTRQQLIALLDRVLPALKAVCLAK